MDPTKEKQLSCKRGQNHQSSDSTEKKKLLHKCKEKYQSMDVKKKKELFQKRTEKYESMNTEAKRDLLDKRKERIKDKATSIESWIKQFKRKIREGPYFICTICNRMLYKKISNEVHKQQVPHFFYPHFSIFNNHLMVKNIYARNVIQK